MFHFSMPDYEEGGGVLILQLTRFTNGSIALVIWYVCVYLCVTVLHVRMLELRVTL